MKKRLIVTALTDRPSMNLSSGDSMELELEGDALLALYHEQSMGLVKVSELSQFLTIQLIPTMEERLKEVQKYNEEEMGIHQTLEDLACSLLYDALYMETKRIERNREFERIYGSQGEN